MTLVAHSSVIAKVIEACFKQHGTYLEAVEHMASI
jgi:hypothetical protein